MHNVTIATRSRPRSTPARLTPPTALTVSIWAWRWMAARRRFRVLPAAVLVLSFFVAWADSFNLNLNAPEAAHLGTYYAFFITSVNQTLLSIVSLAIAAHLVVEDLDLRAHPLVLSTQVSNHAYVWGRFLAGCVLLVGLSLVAQIGTVGAHLALALSAPEAFDAPPWLAYGLAWIFNAPIHTVFVAAGAFALATPQPRMARAIVIGLVLAWWMISVGGLTGMVPPAAAAWLPIPREIATMLYGYYQARYLEALGATTNPQEALQIARAVGRSLPDLRPWLGQLLYPPAALALVEVTARSFDRFRGEEA